MGEIVIRQKMLSTGKTVYQYNFEIASIDGKRKWKSKSGFKTKKEAREAGKEAQRLYEKVGVTVEPSEMSFSDFIDEWIEKSSRLQCKDVTIKGYEKKIRLYIKPKIGEYRLKTITKNMLQDIIIDLFNQGFSYNTISSIRGIFTKSFDYAVDRHYIQISPATKLIIPTAMQPKTETRTKKHIYIPEELREKIFERFPEGSPAYIPMMISYHTGMRLGEVYGLVWEDVDFENQTISVNRQVQWFASPRTKEEKKRTNGSSESDGYWYFSNPKYKSYRKIDMDHALTDILKKEKSKQDKAKAYYDEHYRRYYCNQKLSFGGKIPDFMPMPINKIQEEPTNFEVDFITRREDGSYITERTTQHTSYVIHHQLNFPDYDNHSWRHTHGTMLFENGADVTYVQRRLGHKNLTTTMNIYVNHLTPKIKTRNIATLNEMF